MSDGLIMDILTGTINLAGQDLFTNWAQLLLINWMRTSLFWFHAILELSCKKPQYIQ